tara:strand:- start:749 stop:1114 length:366 start_codon:yes stop_codon:yes gene_type:complete
MNDDEDEMTNDEVHQAVMMAVGELINIAETAAELQISDEAADDMYAMCDLVSAYFDLQRVKMHTEENADGSFTTRVENPDVASTLPRTSSIPGSIRNVGKLKFRVIDKDDATDLDDEEGPQ